MIAPLTWPDGTTPSPLTHTTRARAPCHPRPLTTPPPSQALPPLPKEVQRELETQLLQLRDQLEATGKPREWVAAQLSEQRRSLEAAARDALASAAAAAASSATKKGEKGESSARDAEVPRRPTTPQTPRAPPRLRAG